MANTAESNILKRFLQLDGKQYKLQYVSMLCSQMSSGIAKGKFNGCLPLIEKILPLLQSQVTACQKEQGEYLKINLTNAELKAEIKEALKGEPATRKLPPMNKGTFDNALNGLPVDLDHGCLNGLECIQDDADYTEPEGLNGPGRTPYDVITDLFLERLKKNDLVWRMPWKKGSAARNFKSKKPYKGINALILNFLAEQESPYWLTFKQVEKLGGKIKKGAEAWPAIYYQMIYRDKETNELLSEDQAREYPADKVITIPLIKYYNLFSADDIEGVKFPNDRRDVADEITPASSIVEAMPKKPKIEHGGRKAYYSPKQDIVKVPNIKLFKSDAEYHSVLFHELVHSTGHESRINRNFKPDETLEEYAFEELIAEMGAAFLCGEAGILYHTLDNSAAYVKSWSKRLKKAAEKDNKFILKAAAQAQKAADYILGNKKVKAAKPKANDRKPKGNPKTAKSGQLALGLNGLPAHLAKLVTPMGQTDQSVEHEAFTGPGDLIRFMGGLEIKPRGSIAITLDAPEFSGKTRFFFQAMEAYATLVLRVYF